MLNTQVPDYIRSLIPYAPGKPIEETQREYGIKKVVKLASNENPLGPSPKALAAVRGFLKETHRYPDGGAFALKSALAKYLKVERPWIFVGNGSNEIIDLLVRTFSVAGDSMATSKAAFIAYKLCAQLHGVNTIETALTEDLRFDLDALATDVEQDDRCRMIFLPNPNNPTGTYVNEAEMRAFLDRIAKVRGGGVLVALDYAYWEYVTAKDLPDPMELLADYPNVVVLRTFSKIHGLAGFRLGYAVARPEIIADLERARQPFNVNSLAMVAGIAALADKVFLSKARKVNTAGMKYWEKELKKLGIPLWKSQGNFFLIDTQKGLGKSGAEIYEACLRKGVIFRPVAGYGLPYALRISVGTDAENRFAVKVLREVAGKGKTQ